MAIIILDLDDTLYNTRQFKEDIQKVLFSYGVSIEDIWDTYKIVRSTRNYTFERHIDELVKKYTELDREKALPALIALLSNGYLLPETEKTLKELKKSHTLMLLTSGAERAQRRKIENSGIIQYFDFIYITEKEKPEFIRELGLKGDVYFVNDKADENERIKKHFPHFTIVEIKNGEPIRLPM